MEGLAEADNRTIWDQFDGRYRPMIVEYGRALGLHPQEADEVAQNTLIAFYESYRAGKYDRSKGRLRKWLFGIASNQLKRTLRDRPRRQGVQITGESDRTDLLARIPDKTELAETWEHEWHKAVFWQCLDEVRPQFQAKTTTAFELLARAGWSAKRIAQHLGISENAVFLAKHRVLRAIRAVLPQMESIW